MCIFPAELSEKTQNLQKNREKNAFFLQENVFSACKVEYFCVIVYGENDFPERTILKKRKENNYEKHDQVCAFRSCPCFGSGIVCGSAASQRCASGSASAASEESDRCAGPAASCSASAESCCGPGSGPGPESGGSSSASSAAASAESGGHPELQLGMVR